MKAGLAAAAIDHSRAKPGRAPGMVRQAEATKRWSRSSCPAVQPNDRVHCHSRFVGYAPLDQGWSFG